MVASKLPVKVVLFDKAFSAIKMCTPYLSTVITFTFLRVLGSVTKITWTIKTGICVVVVSHAALLSVPQPRCLYDEKSQEDIQKTFISRFVGARIVHIS